MEDFYFKIRNNRLLNLFVMLLRLLIGFAFIPSGYKKLINHRFTSLGTDTQIGFFFEGLYQSGSYWQFLGFVQIFAALLLMTQRFATVGNMLFFGIISNICIITFSMHFSGTVVITSLLVMSSLFLMFWDFHKIKYLFQKDNFSIQNLNYDLKSYHKIWIYMGFILFLLSLLISACNLSVLGNRIAMAFLCVIVLYCIIYTSIK